MIISKVINSIFIGDVSANDETIIKEFKIKNVLTLSSEPLKTEQQLSFVNYNFVYMLDIENQNIFTSKILQRTFDLINECYKNNISILSGISRSSTIVTAFLMKLNNWGFNDSLEFLKEKHSISRPNDSFIKQLEIFERIGLITDPIELKKSAIFRDFMSYDSAIYNLDESYLLSSKKYSCKKCRRILFFDFNILKHFSSNEQSICEFRYLITPMVWMDLSKLKGKINCPGCHIKLGTFNWDGQRCQYINSVEVECGKYSNFFHLIF